MTRRGDIRRYFEHEAAAFPTPAGLRASIAAEAGRDVKLQRPGMRLAAVVAVALAVAIVTGLVASGALRHVNPPVPVVKAGQHGLVLDADAVDGSTAWALLADCPGNDPASQCAYWVETTQDGGRSWVQPVKIVTTPFTNGDSPRHIHFSDSRNGFVYGNGMAFATHDGGRTWSRILTSATEIVSIDGHGPVWAVVYPCGKGAQCAYQVLESPDGGQTWWMMSALPPAYSPRSAVPYGPGGLLLTGFGAGDMALFRPGISWAVIPGRCSPSSLSNSVASADGNEIWQYCAEPTGIADTLWVSEDGGVSWTKRSTAGLTTTAPVLISSQRGTAVMLSSTATNVGSSLLVSTNAGRTWHPVLNAGVFTTISFAAAGGVASAVDNHMVVWSSTDGGLTWARLPGQP